MISRKAHRMRPTSNKTITTVIRRATRGNLHQMQVCSGSLRICRAVCSLTYHKLSKFTQSFEDTTVVSKSNLEQILGESLSLPVHLVADLVPGSRREPSDWWRHHSGFWEILGRGYDGPWDHSFWAGRWNYWRIYIPKGKALQPSSGSSFCVKQERFHRRWWTDGIHRIGRNDRGALRHWFRLYKRGGRTLTHSIYICEWLYQRISPCVSDR